MSLEKKQCTAIVLAAGSGRRMGSATAKQFLPLGDKPVIWYSLQAVERSEIIDRCILVAREQEVSRVKKEIVEKYDFDKVAAVVPGGGERFESVYQALCLAAREGVEGYIFIHDGARPFLTEEILRTLYEEVCRNRACVAAVPVKDTIKLADGEGFAVQTPDRSRVWAVQTPQVFEAELILEAYRKLFERKAAPEKTITDDAMVVEEMLGIPVKLVEASYRNIKITTPEDLLTAESFLSGLKNGALNRPEKA